jgi:ectoine hydroxylase-related dioxygenase (phytanoyl-CoA dioxygenase family)
MTDFDIDREYPLPPDAIERFREHGFVHLKHVLSTEALAHYGRVITRLTIDLNTQTLPLEERSTYDRAFLQVMNLWRHDETARAFVMGKTLARIATQLLEVEGVRLYHDQSLYKEPGGGITPAHADQYYWPLATDRTVTAWVPLQPVPADMGPLAFFAGSHRSALGRDLPISDESERRITAEMEAQGYLVIDEVFELGDVTFHGGWLFHRAGPNVSTEPRSVMTVIYMDRDMTLAAPTNDMQKADWDKWCPEAKLGEVINTALNPVIYERAL